MKSPRTNEGIWETAAGAFGVRRHTGPMPPSGSRAGVRPIDEDPSSAHQTIERALRILECLFEARRPLRLAEISRALDLERSTTLRILRTLEAMRYVHRDPEQKQYVLGYMSQRLGARPRLLETNARHAEPFLRRLSAELGETVALGAVEGVSVIFHRCIYGGPGKAPPLDLGCAYDAHASATGKMLLANTPEDALARLYRHQRLARHARATITSFDALMVDLQVAWSNGYATEIDEMEDGISAVALPVVNPRRVSNMAISVIGTTSSFDAARRAHIVERCRALVREIYDYVIR